MPHAASSKPESGIGAGAGAGGGAGAGAAAHRNTLQRQRGSVPPAAAARAVSPAVRLPWANIPPGPDRARDPSSYTGWCPTAPAPCPHPPGRAGRVREMRSRRGRAPEPAQPGPLRARLGIGLSSTAPLRHQDLQGSRPYHRPSRRRQPFTPAAAGGTAGGSAGGGSPCESKMRSPCASPALTITIHFDSIIAGPPTRASSPAVRRCGRPPVARTRARPRCPSCPAWAWTGSSASFVS